LQRWTYDDASRVIKKTFANGTYETYSYDARSRVEWIRLFNSSNQQLSSHGYTYDPASNVLTRTDNGVTTTFGYDDIGQLTSESRPGYSATYSYDKNGNRLTRSVNGVTEVYAYDDADKLLNIKVNGVVVKSFSYDLAGRTTGITDPGGTTSLVYDYEDRVTSISRPGMTTNTFAYNGFGARVGKTDSGGTTTFLRSGTSVVAPVVSVSGAESATFTPGISERRGTDSRFYHGDIKNFVEQTNDQGNIVSSQQYDAFGNLVSSSGTWNGPFAYGGKFGYQTDGDTTLHLLGHRYYDSTTGRFLSRDPIKDGRNWYAYSDNEPIGLSDPAGMRPLTSQDTKRLHALRGAMEHAGMNPVYVNEVTRAIKREIASVVSADPPRLKALWYAIDHLGDGSYGLDGRGWKCNILVYDAYLFGGGVPMPDRVWWRPFTQPYGAAALADPRLDSITCVLSPVPVSAIS
jgi:RHS repeat-associated protein